MGPGPTAERRRTDYLYDVLYIYKYDKEGERWLVGPSQVFSQYPLIGVGQRPQSEGMGNAPLSRAQLGGRGPC
jgi:hypothetical protein